MRLLSLHLLVLLLAGAGCAKNKGPASEGKTPADDARKATLLFTSDLWGQLEPCGCSADMRGGLDRAATFVAQERRKGPTLLIDAGDALFDSLSYRPDQEIQAKLKARAVAASLQAMGLSAKAVFPRDEVDVDLLRKSFEQGVLLDQPALRKVGAITIGLVPFDAGSETSDDAALAAIGERLQASRGSGAEITVLLLHAPRQRAVRLGPASGADLVVASQIQNIAEGEEARAVLGGSPTFFVQARGQSILQVEIVLRPGGGPLQVAGDEASRDAEIESISERIRSYEHRIAQYGDSPEAAPFREKRRELQHRRRALSEAPLPVPEEGSYLSWRFVPVTQDFPSDPKVKEILATYDREVAEANLAFAKAEDRQCEAAAPGEAAFVGQASCAACHPAAQAFWETTAHAHAYETLEAINKQYDLNCISCHVIGWEAPGGPCRVDQVEGRKDVGCESCHGPGSLHASAPTEVKLPRAVPEASCRGCHTPEQSTDFDYPSYLQRILGPGHGRPAAPPETK